VPTDPRRPNVVLILADDLGFSDLGCYGGEIRTPNLDRLGRAGTRLSSFYNTARCSPSRASLLTGRHPHETGVGVLTEPQADQGGYPGELRLDVPTSAEIFQTAGYATCLSGKWHLTGRTAEANETFPTRRGFDEFYGIIPGADDYFHPQHLWHGEERLDRPEGAYYLTDAVSDHAAGFVRDQAAQEKPFFLYLAYTAPHWPLHAAEEDVAVYEGVYEAGWDELRAARYERMLAEGVVDGNAGLSPRDPKQPAWADAPHKEWQARRMAVYAAQVEAMDRGIGRVLDQLRASGVEDETIVVFLSDNGACAEDLPPEHSPKFFQRQPSHTPDGRPIRIGNRPEMVPGPDDTFASYGAAWANLSNTPFRFYKRWVHEGGIATPFIFSWPSGGLREGEFVRTPFQLTDILPTLTQAAGIDAAAGPGTSMLDALRPGKASTAHPLFWEHIGNQAARDGKWKIVREADQPWELYDVDRDRSELHDLAAEHPDVVASLTAKWQAWADGIGMVPWEHMRDLITTS
jgi:arylsulfatase